MMMGHVCISSKISAFFFSRVIINLAICLASLLDAFILDFNLEVEEKHRHGTFKLDVKKCPE